MDVKWPRFWGVCFINFFDISYRFRDFGTFVKKTIRPRKFVNPKTKNVSFLGETHTILFSPSKNLLDD